MVKFRRYRRMKPFRPIKAKPLPFRYVLLLSFVFFIFSSAIGLWIVNNGIKPALYAYAESQSVNIATAAINDAIKDQIGEGLSLDEVTRTVNYERSEVMGIDADKIVEYSRKITDSILENIHQVETGDLSILQHGDIEHIESYNGEGIQFEVPFGRITDNALLGSLGPNIPIRFQAIGDVEYDIETTYEELQINSMWYEIRLHIKVGIQIIVPFTTEMKIIPRNVLLAAGQIRGDIPQFYSNGSGFMPSFTMPIDESEDGGE